MNKISNLFRQLADKISVIDESTIPEGFLQDFIARKNFVQGLTGNEDLNIHVSHEQEDDIMYYSVSVFIKDNYIGATSYYDWHEMNNDFSQFNTTISIN